MAAPLTIQAGYPPKMLQEFMGHASITTTLALYGHLYPGDMDRYADRLADAAAEASKAKQGQMTTRAGRPQSDQRVCLREVRRVRSCLVSGHANGVSRDIGMGRHHVDVVIMVMAGRRVSGHRDGVAHTVGRCRRRVLSSPL